MKRQIEKNPLICFKKITLASMGLIGAFPIHLQAAGGLEEVIVTARKTEESIQTVPISVTAMSGEELAKKGAVDLRDISKGNPNVKISEGPGTGVIGVTVAIRGNLQNDVTFQSDPAVGTYVDGLVFARTFAMPGALVDVESVQTLKGPQGTLFGRNTTGGAVVIQTRNPEQDLSGYARVEVGSYNLQHTTGVFNAPITDAVALRLVADVSKRDPFAKQTDGREFGDVNSTAYRAKLAIEPTDNTSILLMAEYDEMHGTPASNLGTQPNDPIYRHIPAINMVQIGPNLVPVPNSYTDEKNQAESQTYSVIVTHQIDDAEIKLTAGQRKLDASTHLSLPPFAGSTTQDKPDNDQKTVELQFNTPLLDDALQLTSGLFYFDEDTHERQTTLRAAPVGTPQALSTIGNANTSSKSKSVYVQGIYSITDSFDIILGGRYTSDKREMPGTYFENGVTSEQNYSFDDNRTNYLVSADYKLNSDIMFYASTASGYRAGSAGIAPDSNNPGRWQVVEPESLVNYELGAKTEWLDKRLRINAALYKQDYSDYQSASISISSTGGFVRGYDNYDAEITGAELEVTAALFDATRVGVSYGYTDAKIKKGKTGTNPNQFKGRGLSNIPDYNYGVFAEQGISVAGGDLTLRADYSYQAAIYTQLKAPKESKIDAIGLLNLSASYSVSDWLLTAYVKNATDEHYYTYTNFLNVPGVPINGGILLNQTYLGTPRTFGLGIQYNF